MNFRIGVDGGGTKTDFILIDENGVKIAQRLSSGCNPSLIGREAAHALMHEQLGSLIKEARALHSEVRISHTLFCMAGSRPFWREFGDELIDFGQVQTYDDSLPVLELAAGAQAGLVMHAGTGSFVAARDPKNETHYAGGLGWRFGDPASAYDLGRHAIGRAIMEMQGWAEPSAIGEVIREASGSTDFDSIIRRYYTDDMPHITVAAVAPRVTALAATGDEVATGIVRNSVRELAQLAQEVINRTFPEDYREIIPVGLSGPILQSTTAQTTVDSILGERCRLIPVTESPIEGVRRMLARL